MLLPTSHRLASLVAAIAVVALAVPATSAARSIDRSSYDAQTEVDGAQPASYLDTGSPDRFDSSRSGPAPTPVAESSADPRGFDWGDAGIGAAVVVGLFMITLSIMFGVVHRRSRSAAT
jgi:hypothetical protein